MSYAFNAASGATRGDLTQLVIANSFGASRYTEPVRGWLNDAVTDVCRKLGLFEGYDILDYDAAGVVTQPAMPYFRVAELWFARATADASGEQAVANAAQWRLAFSADLPAGQIGTQPVFYTVRSVSPTDRLPRPQITVVPAQMPGKVAIHGWQRPPIMDTDDDVSGLGADLDRALVAFAKARAFEAEDDLDLSDKWLQRYDMALRDAAHGGAQSDAPQVAAGAWGDYDGC